MAHDAKHATYEMHDAPEVAQSTTPMLAQESSDKIYAYGQDSNQPQTYPTAHQNSTYFSPAPAYPHSEIGRPNQDRRLWMRAAIVGAVALLVGLGAGIGIGFGAKGSGSSSSPTGASSSNATSATSTASSPTSTASGVISGTTGIASFSCSNKDIYASTSNPTAFTQDCNSDYADGWAAWNSTSSNPYITHNLKFLTAYSFQDCMEQCAIYNKHVQAGNATCQAVTYNANLTFSIATDDGSCFLKDRRGANISQFTNQNYLLIASAYIAADL